MLRVTCRTQFRGLCASRPHSRASGSRLAQAPAGAVLLLLAGLTLATGGLTVPFACQALPPDATDAPAAGAHGPGEAEKAFFAQNASAADVLVLPGGAQARRLQASDGESAEHAELLVLSLNSHPLGQPAAELPDGLAARMRKGQRFTMQQLPLPLADAVRHMRIGERWQVWVPSQQKPPKPATEFEIELLAAH